MITMTFLDNAIMNGHPILGWILQFSDGWERHFCQCLSTNLQSLPDLTRTTIQERSSFRNMTEMKMYSPGAPLPQKAVQFCPLPGQVHHLKWWLTKQFADHVDIFHMYAEIGNEERTEMQLKFHDSQNPSVLVTTPKVGGTGLNYTAANHAVITGKSWVLNDERQAFARSVRLGKTEYHTHWYRIQVLVALITVRVISTNNLEWREWTSCMAWWVDWTSRRWSFAGLWSRMRTRRRGCQRKKTRCSLMNHHVWLLGRFIKVRLVRQ